MRCEPSSRCDDGPGQFRMGSSAYPLRILCALCVPIPPLHLASLPIVSHITCWPMFALTRNAIHCAGTLPGAISISMS